MKSLLDNPQWLISNYVVAKKSTYDIAREVGCDPKTVWSRLKKFGIPTAKRGENLKGEDNYMRTPGVVNPFAGRKHTAETKLALSRKASVPKLYLRGSNNGMYGRVGDKNPNYKGGNSPERQRVCASSEWKAILRRVYKRDGYRCRRCGTGNKGPKSLHAHHVKSWVGYPDSRMDVDNLITLCKTCHDWVHSNENTEREMIL